MRERTRVPTPPRVLANARSTLRSHEADLRDYPSELLHPRRGREPPAVLPEIRGLAADLGLDSDELIPAGSPIERERLAAIEQGGINPSAREEVPGTEGD